MVHRAKAVNHLPGRLIFNTLRPRQNGRHFPDDIFKYIFMNEKFCVLIQISLKFVPKGGIDNKAALVQVMACRLFGAKPLPEPMLIQFTDVYMSALGGDELMENQSMQAVSPGLASTSL